MFAVGCLVSISPSKSKSHLSAGGGDWELTCYVFQQLLFERSIGCYEPVNQVCLSGGCCDEKALQKL